MTNEQDPKFSKLEYDAFKTAPAEQVEPRDTEAWKDAPEGVVEDDDENTRSTEQPKS